MQTCAKHIFGPHRWVLVIVSGLQYPIPTEPKTPIPNTHKVQNSNTQYLQRSAVGRAPGSWSAYLRLEPRGRPVLREIWRFLQFCASPGIEPGSSPCRKINCPLDYRRSSLIMRKLQLSKSFRTPIPNTHRARNCNTQYPQGSELQYPIPTNTHRLGPQCYCTPRK